MMGTMEDAIVGNVEDNQNWDAEVAVPLGGEVAVSEWAEERGANYELKLAFPANPEGDARYLSANGLDSISTNDNSMVVLNLKEGSLPAANSEITQVLVDEGLQHFLDWQVGQNQISRQRIGRNFTRSDSKRGLNLNFRVSSRTTTGNFQLRLSARNYNRDCRFIQYADYESCRTRF